MNEPSNIVSLSLIPRQSIKSSFRDKDKPSRFKDLQTTTRFQVDPQNEDSDESNDSQEERELLDNEYDTKYGKSFRSVCIAPNLVTQIKISKNYWHCNY